MVRPNGWRTKSARGMNVIINQKKKHEYILTFVFYLNDKIMAVFNDLACHEPNYDCVELIYRNLAQRI